ncbi:zinc transport system ATP-binding protein [Sharpea azabuensis]|uniref:metal ABC transporter ATP-binding protein n=1 Tax=Sharpea azabuensis TaxID=322505 RepID=UPI0008E6673B|nr:metal ABC transporter ATP-binding protein [Sharpea azabuensis]SFD80453.1 zinc transport system ATP-binding protein [Sharpea azabuensis]SFK73268.1 zinc transport system ATP-binding protein [Sharpea azabuensis]
MNLINVNHLTLGYEHQKVIKDLSFTVEKGDFITIIGANGSGKSTLVKGLLGLIKPMQGDIQYHIDTKQIGYMPQETKIDATFPASVEEIVLSGTLNRLGHRPFYSKKERKLADDSLALLDILDLKKKSFADLSGGQRQKVLLSRALSATRELLILDEPSNNLDFSSREEFYKIIHRLNKEEGITILMITHDLDMHAIAGNKIIAFEDQEIFVGKIEDYRRKMHESL